jgi:hypothetical protein
MNYPFPRRVELLCREDEACACLRAKHLRRHCGSGDVVERLARAMRWDQIAWIHVGRSGSVPTAAFVELLAALPASGRTMASRRQLPVNGT